MRLIAIAAVFAVGCGASTPVVQYAGISEKQHVEKKKLPDRPDATPIAKADDWVKPLPAATCTIKKKDGTTETVQTKDGILLSPEKAVRAALYKDGYNNLRDLYEIDRQIWGQHRIVYDERLGQANAEVKRLAPSWWDRHKTSIACAAGFAAGAVATVAIVYAVDEVKKQ